MTELLTFLAGISAFFSGLFVEPQEPSLGAFGDPFISIQLAASPSNGDCLTTDGTDNAWGDCGTGTFPFTVTSHFGTTTSATSTPLFLQGNLYSLFASSTSVFTNASTTQLTVSGGLYDTNNSRGSSAEVLSSTGSAVDWITCTTLTGSADLCDGNDSTGSSAFEMATTSDIAVPNLAYFTKTGGRTTLGSVATTTLSGTANQITVSNSPVVIGSAGAALTLPSHVIFPGNFEATNATTTNATTTSLNVTGAYIDFDNLTSALVLTGAGGILAEYAGTSCTNQFVRSLSALGAATCETVANTDLANSTVSYGGVQLSLGGTDATPAFDLTDATSLPIVNGTTGTLTVARGGTGQTTFTSSQLLYGNGTAALSSVATGTISAGTGIALDSAVRAAVGGALAISINQAANLTWTGAHDFGGATSLEIPNGANPTVDAIGEIAFDTTSPGSLTIATSTNASYPGVIPIPFYFHPQFASSTWTSTSTAEYTTLDFPERITGGTCYTNAGSVLVRLGDGTNFTNATAVTTSTTTITLTSNNTWNAGGEKVIIQAGTPASSPTRVFCSFKRFYERL